MELKWWHEPAVLTPNSQLYVTLPNPVFSAFTLVT